MSKRTRKTKEGQAEGYPIRDARKDLVITVTKNDIKSAKPEDSYACAAAHALCRDPKYKKAKVTKNVTYVLLTNGWWERYITPADLYVELIVFDRGGRMEPADYKLTAPKGSMRLGHHAKPRGPHKTAGQRKTVHTIDHVRPNAPKGIGAFKALMEGR